MNAKARYMAHAAIIAALYTVLTHLQNIIAPGSASWAIQMRLSEALCVLAFFTPAAIPGLTLGCMVFNFTSGAALPPDWIIGSAATFLAAQCMYRLRQVKLLGLPVLGLCMPALFNAILVGLELTYYFGGGFLFNAGCVAAGELIVLLTAGSLLYRAMKRRKLDIRLFR